MTILSSLPLNIIPNLPTINQELVQVIKHPDGIRYQIHPAWHNFFSQLTTALQNNLSNEGLIIPKQSAANIANLDVSDPNKFGSTIYDRDNHLAKININGVYETITTS